MALTVQYRLKIEGMRCASCAAAAERALRETPGVTEAAVNLALSSGEIRGGADLNPQDAVRALEKLGYHAALLKEEDTAVSATKDYHPAEVA
ncbi:MAG: cation transporter, partial [Clostridia bacterium]